MKIFLLAAMLMIPIVIAVIFSDYRRTSDKEGDEGPSLGQGANVSVNRVHQTAVRDGVTEWTLDADSVRYADAEKQAFFEKLSVSFFLENRKKLRLTADQGLLKTDSNDMEVFGNVVIIHGPYRIETDRLRYEHGSRVFSSESRVKITGEDFDLGSDSLSFQLNSGKAFFKGNVKGMMSEKIPL